MRAFHLLTVSALLVSMLIAADGNVVLAVCPAPPIKFTRTDVTVDAATDGPKVIALSDVNRDGKGDLIVCSGSMDQVDIYLNDGRGAFPNPAQSFATAAAPVAVVTGNFNGDGKPDLAVVSGADDVVSILLGDGTGDFSNRRDFSVSALPVSVIAADFNGDGVDDLAVLSDTGIDILKNDGSGNFLPFPGSPVSTRASASADLVAGKFNGDGYIDIVVANRGASQVVVFLGKGDGTFQFSRINSVGQGPVAIASADLDSDGNMDLAVVNGDEIADRNVSLLYGNGDGTFKDQVVVTAETEAKAIAFADFDLDAKVDMAVVSVSGGGDLVIYHNDPNQNDPAPPCSDSFESGFSKYTATEERALAIGNLVAVQAGQINGDGRPDLVMLSSDGATVWVFTNVQPVDAPTNTPTAPPTPAATLTPTPTASPTLTNTPTATATASPIPTASPRPDESGCSIDRSKSTGRSGLWLVILPMLITCRRCWQ
jgi:hypothetical protein